MYNNFNTSLYLNENNAYCEKTYEWFLDDYKKKNNLTTDELKNHLKSILKSFKRLILFWVISYVLMAIFAITSIVLILISNLVKNVSISQNSIAIILPIVFVLLVFISWSLSNSLIRKKYVNVEILRFIFYKENINLRDWGLKSFKIYKRLLSLTIKV